MPMSISRKPAPRTAESVPFPARRKISISKSRSCASTYPFVNRRASRLFAKMCGAPCASRRTCAGGVSKGGQTGWPRRVAVAPAARHAGEGARGDVEAHAGQDEAEPVLRRIDAVAAGTESEIAAHREPIVRRPLGQRETRLPHGERAGDARQRRRGRG